MEKLNLKGAVAFGNSAFTRLDKAEALYEELVERLYALGEDVANRIEKATDCQPLAMVDCP